MKNETIDKVDPSLEGCVFIPLGVDGRNMPTLKYIMGIVSKENLHRLVNLHISLHIFDTCSEARAALSVLDSVKLPGSRIEMGALPCGHFAVMVSAKASSLEISVCDNRKDKSADIVGSWTRDQNTSSSHLVDFNVSKSDIVKRIARRAENDAAMIDATTEFRSEFSSGRSINRNSIGLTYENVLSELEVIMMGSCDAPILRRAQVEAGIKSSMTTIRRHAKTECQRIAMSIMSNLGTVRQ